jgi:LPS-assembly lipoprotein
VKRLARMLSLAALLSLTACGLHLRGHEASDRQFAFRAIYIQAPGETAFTRTLRRGLKAYKIDVEAQPGKQQVTLDVLGESTEKQITALNASGHVIEYLVHYRVSLRAYDAQHNDWLPVTEIELQRILPWDDTLVLAKLQEEQMLYDEMRTDAAQQVLRRLAYARVRAAEDEVPADVPPPASAPAPSQP